MAFELHSIGLGANTGFQLLGDRRVFGFARDAIDERLAPLKRTSAPDLSLRIPPSVAPL